MEVIGIVFDSFGFYALECDGRLVSWMTPHIPGYTHLDKPSMLRRVIESLKGLDL